MSSNFANLIFFSKRSVRSILELYNLFIRFDLSTLGIEVLDLEFYFK